MAIAGFNFTKINVEKIAQPTGKINISNNVAIKNVEQKNLSLGKSKQNAIEFHFEFTSTYDPKVGEILIGGDILFLDDEKKVKEILDEWKKSKKIPKDVMSQILNTALMKCNIQALVLSQDVNLPPPIPLPRVQSESK